MHQTSDYKPLVTVLLPVFNAEDYLLEAVESILDQTYKNIVLLALDDGSTDQSLSILKSAQQNDSRVQIISRENQGLVATLNEGISLSEGKYIARMDADDVSLPTRIEKQVALLEQHGDVGVCGCHYSLLGASSQKVYVHVDHDYIAARLIFGVPLAHPSALIRKSILIEKNIRYSEDYQRAQDYELWSRMIKVTKFASVNEVLLRYRIHESQISVVNTAQTLKGHINITKSMLEELELYYSDKEILDLLGKSDEISSFKDLRKNFQNISQRNLNKAIYDQDALNTILSKRLLYVASKYVGLIGVLKVRRDPVFSNYIHIPLNVYKQALKKSIKIILKR